MRTVVRILRRALYLYAGVLLLVTLVSRMSGLPFLFSSRWSIVYFIACLAVSTGARALTWAKYDDEPFFRTAKYEDKDWEAHLKD